jgi:predicted GIY-YIG superfamily endonuclease
MGVIYKLTSPSGKSYIGQTKRSFNERWVQHKTSANGNYQHCISLENAIQKYGAENFTTKILFDCNDDIQLDKLEIMAIKLFFSNNPTHGYNLTSGGKNYKEITNNGKIISLSDYHRKKHGNNLPKYIIKTGCKNAGKSGYQITNHPKCKRKRFTGETKDDALSLERTIKYLEKLEKGEIVEKEILPQYISYVKGHDSYSVQIPMKGKPNLRKEFRDKKLTKEERKQKALDQLTIWKIEYNIK